jgi:hypothetical protein
VGNDFEEVRKIDRAFFNYSIPKTGLFGLANFRKKNHVYVYRISETNHDFAQKQTPDCLALR